MKTLALLAKKFINAPPDVFCVFLLNEINNKLQKIIVQTCIQNKSINCLKNFRNLQEFNKINEQVRFFHDSGQFYWGRIKAWKELKIRSYGLGLKIPSYRFFDNKADWSRAELLSQIAKI